MVLQEAILESWRRNCFIYDNVLSLLSEEMLHYMQDENGWTISEQLAHVQNTRAEWLERISPEHAESLISLWTQVDDSWEPSYDVSKIRSALKQSGMTIGQLVNQLLENNVQQAGPYDHPIMFLQHMLWHEGWHMGILIMSLRVNHCELPDEIECQAIWDMWRIEER
jgi:uncharacterized damage-inducible protein DinB